MTNNSTRYLGLGMACLLACNETALAATDSAEERNLTELRNTVVNLLQALVEKGVLTREQAELMVKNAQEKAQAEAAAKIAQQKAQEDADKGAVRVPYVPQIVKDEIRKEVVAELGPSVKQDVVQQINKEGTLREALPEWVRRMHWTSDVRMREEGDQFGHDNAQNKYLDFQAINSKGGIAQAGTAALLNTTLDRDRLRLRARFGFDADVGSGWSTGVRLATGTGETYITTNQTLGTYGARYQITLDQGFVRWLGSASSERQLFTATAGRFANPWVSTDLVWYNDLTFEGVATNYRLNLGSDNTHRHDLFVTLGGFPLQDVVPSSQNKWLLGGQLGADLLTSGESRFRVGAAYYDYVHLVGQVNAPTSTLNNYTGPPLVQKGNTLFPISGDPTTDLFAIASDFRIVDLTAIADWHAFTRYSLSVTAEALKNIGYKSADVSQRVGAYVGPRNRGYRLDLGFGSNVQAQSGAWRTTVGYRYLERDAVVDAFNDQDFHLGGTDAKGYTVTFDYSFNPHVWARMKYLSANAIDGPPLAIDVWQIDINTQF